MVENTKFMGFIGVSWCKIWNFIDKMIRMIGT